MGRKAASRPGNDHEEELAELQRRFTALSARSRTAYATRAPPPQLQH